MLGMLEGVGRVRCAVVPDRDGRSAQPIVLAGVPRGEKVMTGVH